MLEKLLHYHDIITEATCLITVVIEKVLNIYFNHGDHTLGKSLKFRNGLDFFGKNNCRNGNLLN